MMHKVFDLASFKALSEPSEGPDGTFEAIVAIFNNVDRAGDRILPGAFAKSLERWRKSGDPIPILFSHEWDNLDAHIGWVLQARELGPGDKELPASLADLGGLYVQGQIDLEEDFAARVWKRLQQRRIKQFSFAYDVIDSTPVKESEKVTPSHYQDLVELDLLEVGPCLVGMNPATQLLGTKAAFPGHSTETSDADWDGPANAARVRSGESQSYYRRIYAWRDPEGEEGAKSSYRFIHHEVSAEGDPGAANIRACQTGIGVLNGARGGTTIPEEDHQGVYAHLARHLRDADVEPAPLKAQLQKAGARHTAKEFEKIQQIHDLAVALGATCPGEATESGEGEGEGKSASGATSDGLRPSTLGLRLAMELLEIH